MLLGLGVVVMMAGMTSARGVNGICNKAKCDAGLECSAVGILRRCRVPTGGSCRATSECGCKTSGRGLARKRNRVCDECVRAKCSRTGVQLPGQR